VQHGISIDETHVRAFRIPIVFRDVTQFFDHFNFLIVDVLQRGHLGQILAQQAVEVLIATTLPSQKGSAN
jgi:hypothetical protein